MQKLWYSAPHLLRTAESHVWPIHTEPVFIISYLTLYMDIHVFIFISTGNVYNICIYLFTTSIIKKHISVERKIFSLYLVKGNAIKLNSMCVRFLHYSSRGSSLMPQWHTLTSHTCPWQCKRKQLFCGLPLVCLKLLVA